MKARYIIAFFMLLIFAAKSGMACGYRFSAGILAVEQTEKQSEERSDDDILKAFKYEAATIALLHVQHPFIIIKAMHLPVANGELQWQYFAVPTPPPRS